MHRRNFLALVSGAVAAVLGGLGLRRSPRKAMYLRRSASPEIVTDRLLLDEGEWPETYVLMVKLPQPKNRPMQVPAGISYWIERPTVLVACRHAGSGFYVGEHLGMKLRALAERDSGTLICKTTVWDGEWNV